MRQFDRVYAKIYIDRIEENMEAMQKNLKSGTKMFGVVKADAYGHGAVPVAKAIDQYVDGYAVATAEEALQLRKHGITKKILILGVTPFSFYQEIIEKEIRPAIFRMKDAELLSEMAVSMNKKIKIHIAVDTGMGRIGVTPTEESSSLIKKISELPGIEIEGIFTHFARADELDKKYAKEQIRLFQEFLSMIKEKGVQIPIKHCSNSAGIMDLKEANMDAVRAGITMYGLYPSDEVDKKSVPLKPAMELKSFVTFIKEIEAGTAVSYGGTFVAEKQMRIGTVGIGYADGYPRNASGKGNVLICGKKVPILGRVCMDQLMIDLSEVPEAQEGEEVTLIGKDHDQEISMEDLAAVSGGFHYEIPCLIGKRVPRVYVSGGHVIGAQFAYDCEYDGFL